MTIICPTITAENPHIYREQIERIQSFAKRLHIDLMDGAFTENKGIELAQVWWPEHVEVDIHLMFQNPEVQLPQLIKLQPNLVIIQAETTNDIPTIASQLNESSIKCGIALLPQTPVEVINYTLAEVQHVLIFSGNLGHQGNSVVDFKLLEKVKQLKTTNPSLEVAWDGGVDNTNAQALAEGGVDVLDVGSFIQAADNPKAAYDSLTTATN